jgi:hypothetical protein
MFQPFSHLVQIISAALNFFTRKRTWHNPFQDGYFLRILKEKRSALLFLVDQVGFRHRFLKPREDPCATFWKFRSSWISPFSWCPRW